MNGDRLAIAGIHATVLSIFVAIFSSLGLFYHASGEQRRVEVVQEGNKAGDVVRIWTSISVGGNEICQSQRERDWELNHQEIAGLCKAPHSSSVSGEALFCSMYSLLSGYPYVVQDELLRRSGRMHRFSFQEYDQVVRWSEDYRAVSSTLRSCKETIAPKLEEYNATINWRNSASDYVKTLYSVTSELDIFVDRLQQRISQVKATPFVRYGGRYVLPIFLALSLLAFMVLPERVWVTTTGSGRVGMENRHQAAIRRESSRAEEETAAWKIGSCTPSCSGSSFRG